MENFSFRLSKVLINKKTRQSYSTFSAFITDGVCPLFRTEGLNNKSCYSRCPLSFLNFLP